MSDSRASEPGQLAGEELNRRGVSLETPHLMAAVGDEVEAPIRVCSEQGVCGPRTLNLMWHDDPLKPASGRVTTLTTDASGRALLPIKATQEGLLGWTVCDAASGVCSRLFADVLNPTEWAEFEQAAGAIALDEPVHCLHLGDSLTDANRGFNQADKIDYWLNRHRSGRSTFKNAAVGGDTVTGLWAKLNGNISPQERERYPQWQEPFSPRPNWVFVFLGHNDSKLTAASHYQESYVPLPEFEQTLRDSLHHIQQAARPDRLVVLSCARTQYERTSASMTRNKNYFGEPRTMARYNASMARIAREMGGQYVDIYDSMAQTPDQAALFNPDGIHLCNKGNRFVALQLLRAMAR